MITDHSHIDGYTCPRHCLHHDFIVNSLKQDTEYFSCHLSCADIHDIDILRTDYHIHRLFFLESKVYTVKGNIIKPDFIIRKHHTRNNITLPNEIRYKPVCRLIINILGCSHLLDFSVFHNHDLIRHGKSLFLVMGDKDESDADFLLDPLELVLHFFSQL